METENEGRLTAAFSRLQEKIQEQPAFQQLRGKYDELDPQSRLYLRGAAIGITSLAFVGILLTSYLSARRARLDLQERTALTELVQNASEELRLLREKGGGNIGQAAGRPETAAPWAPYIESQATQIGLPKEGFSVGVERDGKSTEQTKESLIDVQLKKINIKQLARFATGLERGSRPVKVRAMTLDAQTDSSGYLDATLALSAFNPK